MRGKKINLTHPPASYFGALASLLTSHLFFLGYISFLIGDRLSSASVIFFVCFKSRQGVCVGLNPILVPFQTQTTFSHATMPEVWPRRGGCCDGGWVVWDAGWCDTEPMVQTRVVQARICDTHYIISPKQRSLNPLKHTLSCFLPIICVWTSGTFTDTEGPKRPTLFYSGKTENQKLFLIELRLLSKKCGRDRWSARRGAADPHVPDPLTTVRWMNCQFPSVWVKGGQWAPFQ